MIVNNNDNVAQLVEKAYQYLLDSNYKNAINSYEQLIELEPTNKSFYWYLGLVFLLKGEETEAQTLWYLFLEEHSDEEKQTAIKELTEILIKEADRKKDLREFYIAWVIRQHVKEINPTDINNLLEIVNLSIEMGDFIVDDLFSLGINHLLKKIPSEKINLDLLIKLIKKLSSSILVDDIFLFFFQTCLPHMHCKIQDFMEILIPFIYELSYVLMKVNDAIDLCEIALKIEPCQPEIPRTLAYLYVDIGNFERAFFMAEKSYSLSQNLPQRVFNNYLRIRALIYSSGYNEKVFSLLELQKSLISSLAQENQLVEYIIDATRLYNTSFYFPHTEDNPRDNIKFRKIVAEFCQKNIEYFHTQNIKKYNNNFLLNVSHNKLNKPLKVGYISYCLRRHSVGWLARSLFFHHNRNDFQIYAYLLASKNSSDSITQWYTKQVYQAHQFGSAEDELEIATQINNDEIDILVDLDSITIFDTSTVLAMKPAPVQATWLGWDASSIPTIDYFIADPYVLPADAEDYYQEKIWRLPKTYLAIDGFGVSVPSLKRHDLDIPDHAVVYFTSQMGHKYHPENIKLQMQILHEVPNSYFVIKSFGEMQQLEEILIEIAESEGVRAEQIKFIKPVALEEIHRANLAIADIVLDTYPYNGATTTMETLWMGIPMVTKVGQQFAARNSYSMMINAGITEGIAWTDEEYVEWGIRLGKDENLRRDIAWKLKKGRQTAPLWNAKQFTRDMENTYQQMWQIYLDGGGK
jgi:predicted O-linked N-acetylglucosamine transferase (SPINDLY family)